MAVEEVPVPVPVPVPAYLDTDAENSACTSSLGCHGHEQV